MTGKWVIRVHVQRGTNRVYSLICAEKTGSFCPQDFLKMADDWTGRVPDVCFEVLCQSMPIDERFLCGYRLIID